jgi:hypothetical protein
MIVFVGLLISELWASTRLLRKVASSQRTLPLAGLLSLVGVLLMGFSFDMLLTPYVFLALFWNRAIREVYTKRAFGADSLINDAALTSTTHAEPVAV